MTKKSAVIITYNHYFDRVLAVKERFNEDNIETVIFTSDFIHKKGYIAECDKKDFACYIHSKAYNKNLSISRLLAYMKWSKSVAKKIKEHAPDIVYFLIPPNSLFKALSKIKKKKPEIKLFVDIYDMWPESLPVSKKKKRLLSPILNAWRNLRNKNFSRADAVFCECGYYTEILKKQNIDTSKFVNLYLFGDAPREDIKYKSSETLRFLYLGSINNIIDIDRIVQFLKLLKESKKVLLNIIGAGEQKDRFLSELEQAEIETVFHGEIYDDAEKQSIMNNCDFGLNVYKDGLAIGLTMKSIDYFRGGLPIINTIAGDTSELVRTKEIGYNLISLEETVSRILNLDHNQYTAMRKNVTGCYLRFFTKDVFLQTLRENIALSGDA